MYDIGYRSRDPETKRLSTDLVVNVTPYILPVQIFNY